MADPGRYKHKYREIVDAINSKKAGSLVGGIATKLQTSVTDPTVLENTCSEPIELHVSIKTLVDSIWIKLSDMCLMTIFHTHGIGG